MSKLVNIICVNNNCNHNKDEKCTNDSIELYDNNDGFMECLTDTTVKECIKCGTFKRIESMTELEKGYYCNDCFESYDDEKAFDDREQRADYDIF